MVLPLLDIAKRGDCPFCLEVVGGSSGVSTWRGQARQLAPPPPIGYPVRSMQIRGDFHGGKMGIG